MFCSINDEQREASNDVSQYNSSKIVCTDGWRGIIADDLLSQCPERRERSQLPQNRRYTKDRPVLAAYDTRFAECSPVLRRGTGSRLDSKITERDCSHLVIAHNACHLNSAGDVHCQP